MYGQKINKKKKNGSKNKLFKIFYFLQISSFHLKKEKLTEKECRMGNKMKH